MPLCFEVAINDELPIRAGLPDLKVLTAIVSFVADRDELDLDVGGMVDRSDHVRWLQRDLRRGDVVTIRIVDSEEATEPVMRERVDSASDAERERAYYEHLRRKYEPEKS